MTLIKYWVVQEDDEEEILVRYTNIVDEEEYEEADDPGGFEGIQKGSNICETPPEEDIPDIKPWDPSENFFARIQ